MGETPKQKRLVLAGTILGALVGVAFSMPHENSEASGWWRTPLVRENAAVRPIRFAIWGAVIGLAADLVVNGRPNVRSWKFNLKTLFFAVFACAMLLWGIRCYLEMRNPWSEMFFGKHIP